MKPLLRDVSENLMRLLPDFDERFEVERSEDEMSVTPREEDTYPILVYDNGDEVIVYAGHWHEHIADTAQAAYLVMWLLTPYYRVNELYEDDELLVSYLERYRSGEWESYLTIYFGNPDVMRNANRKVTRQQAVLRPPDAILEEYGITEEGLPPNTQLGIHSCAVQEPILFEHSDIADEYRVTKELDDNEDALGRFYDIARYTVDQCEVDVEDDRILVRPSAPETFMVGLERTETGHTLRVGEFAWEIEDDEEALNLASQLIIGVARLVIALRGDRRHSAWVETFDVSWKRSALHKKIGLPLLPPNRLEITQQNLLPPTSVSIEDGSDPAELGLDPFGHPLDSHWGTKVVEF